MLRLGQRSRGARELRGAGDRGRDHDLAIGAVGQRLAERDEHGQRGQVEHGGEQPATIGLDRRLRRRCREGERGILLEDAALELAQRGSRLDPELVDQGRARGAERVERFGLAPAAIQREHLQRPEALAQRVLGDERGELGRRLGVAPARQVCLERALERDEAQLVDARGDRTRARLAGQVRQRGAAPERQPGTQLGGGVGGAIPGQRVLGDAQVALEAPQIERVIGDGDGVAAPARADHVAAERFAQGRDVALHDVLGGLWRVVAPHAVDQPADWDGLVGVGEQDREHGPLPRTAEGRGHAVGHGLERPQDAELEPQRWRA